MRTTIPFGKSYTNSLSHRFITLPCEATSGVSLNDLPLPGPCLYPLLSMVINCFHLHPVCMAGDVRQIFGVVTMAAGYAFPGEFHFISPTGEISIKCARAFCSSDERAGLQQVVPPLPKVSA